MASKKKAYWYVLVMTDEGPKFVTGTGEGKMAMWDKTGVPLEMDKSNAQEMALGLTWNGNTAFSVGSKYAMDRQPYNYEKWHIEWKENEE